jgi:hypothetical protein
LAKFNHHRSDDIQEGHDATRLTTPGPCLRREYQDGKLFSHSFLSDYRGVPMNLRNKGESSTQAMKVELLSDRIVQNIATSHIYFRRKERKNAKHLQIADLQQI